MVYGFTSGADAGGFLFFLRFFLFDEATNSPSLLSSLKSWNDFSSYSFVIILFSNTFSLDTSCTSSLGTIGIVFNDGS